MADEILFNTLYFGLIFIYVTLKDFLKIQGAISRLTLNN